MRIACWQTILMKYHTIFLSKLGKVSQNLSSAAVLITPAKWSRTVLECSKIILEFSRTMF